MGRYRAFYSKNYYAEIGDGHVFPIRKFELVRNILIDEGTLNSNEIEEPLPALFDDLALVHDPSYLKRMISGNLGANELRRLGLPWSESLVRRTLLAVAGTIAASATAIEAGVASNLAGGTHHAFPDRGEGFCVLNDVAVAIAVLRKRSLANRFLIVDCDVHQGNGTAFIFKDDEDVFTFSIHGEKNYPLRKEMSDLDIELPDFTADEEYLRILEAAIDRISHFSPDLVFYLAGADPFQDDKLGRLSLSKAGLAERDGLVLRHFAREHIPIVTVMSGGYAREMMDTVDIHCNTIRMVKKVFGDLDKEDSPRGIWD
ncbi:MAG: histone deacetylase [Pyrinomonadaceae bacterium]